MPVSAKGIRGQLRFWWRTLYSTPHTQNAGAEAIDLMRLREGEIFGNQDSRSPFDLRIQNVSHFNAIVSYGSTNEIEKMVSFSRNGATPRRLTAAAYALFPLQKVSGTLACADLSFTLVIQWISEIKFIARRSVEQERRDKVNVERKRRGLVELPPTIELKRVQQELKQALWAWLHFGGLGSRTRRGLGSLALGPRADKGLYSFEQAPGKPLHCHPEIYLSTNAFKEPSEAWCDALAAIREFRQDRGGQHDNKILKLDGQRFNAEPARVQGRSHWPEPDSIRLATKSALAPRTLYVNNGKISSSPPGDLVRFEDHTQPAAAGGTLPAYPRAILGLPIMFHFADGPNPASNAAGISASQRDPQDTALVPCIMNEEGQMVAGERMASSVIAKPLLLKDGWHAAVIILHPPANLEAVLQKKQKGKKPVTITPVPHNQIAGPDVSGFAPMLHQENALDALVAYLHKHSFHRHGVAQ